MECKRNLSRTAVALKIAQQDAVRIQALPDKYDVDVEFGAIASSQYREFKKTAFYRMTLPYVTTFYEARCRTAIFNEVSDGQKTGMLICMERFCEFLIP